MGKLPIIPLRLNFPFTGSPTKTIFDLEKQGRLTMEFRAVLQTTLFFSRRQFMNAYESIRQILGLGLEPRTWASYRYR